MHTRELSVGSQTLSFETGKLAKQADGAVVVRLGDTVVLVTACHAANPREGIDFLPLTVDYQEYTYASGRIPGGFFKREGKPAEKEVLTSRVIDRPIRPLFPAGWRYETQIIALVLSADTRERLRRAGDHRRLGRARALGDPVPEDDRRRPRRPGRRRVRHQPDLRAAEARAARPHRRRHARRHRDGRSRREGSDRRGGGRARSKPAHAAIKRDRRGDRRARQGGRQARSAQVAEEGDRPRRSTARSKRRRCAPLTEAMRLRDKLENYGRVDQVLEELVASLRRRRSAAARSNAKAIFKELKEKVLRDEVLERGVRLDGRKFDEIRADLDRKSGVLPRVARLGGVHARRDAGARHGDARHRRRSAEDRDGGRRDLQALHAALQLPAVLGRRSRVHARPRPPRRSATAPWPSARWRR